MKTEMPYLHGEGSGLLIIVIEQVGHKGCVVREALAHPKCDGLAGERAVTACRLHVDSHTCGQKGSENPNETHCLFSARSLVKPSRSSFKL